MTIERIRNDYNAAPFQPFVIHLADGRAIPAPSCEFMAAAPNGRTIVVYQSDSTANVIDPDCRTSSAAPQPSCEF